MLSISEANSIIDAYQILKYITNLIEMSPSLVTNSFNSFRNKAIIALRTLSFKFKDEEDYTMANNCLKFAIRIYVYKSKDQLAFNNLLSLIMDMAKNYQQSENYNKAIDVFERAISKAEEFYQSHKTIPKQIQYCLAKLRESKGDCLLMANANKNDIRECYTDARAIYIKCENKSQNKELKNDILNVEKKIAKLIDLRATTTILKSQDDGAIDDKGQFRASY